MLINIFCFLNLCSYCQNIQISLSEKGTNLKYKRLKIRKLNAKRTVFPAFQSTILRTFFELAKIFLKKRRKKLLTMPVTRVRATQSVHFSLMDFSALAASCRKRLYQPGWDAGRNLGMRAAGRPVLNGFLIMAGMAWMSPHDARAECNRCSARNRVSCCEARNPV